MLDTLRRGATSWVAKVLLGLLVISFGIWGVADVFRGYGQGALAHVGNKEITLDQFQNAYQRELDLISRQFGRRLTPEQARAFGVDARVLSRLISAAAVDEHAHDMRLAVSQDAVVESIRNDPAFQGPDGQFNRFALDNIARQLGLSEKGLLDLRRQEDLRDQITGALAAGIAVPDALLKIINEYREETRTAEHFTIDPAVAVKLAEPDEAKLRETYEANKQQFVTPEFRRVALLALKLDDIKKRVPVSEEEVKAFYEHEAQRFDIPEKRRVQQVAFKSKAEAEQASRDLAKGKTFEEIAVQAGAKPTDIDLGLLTKRDFIDQAIADAAFSLPKNGVSPVVEGRFATVLVKVMEIEPGRHRPLAEVENEIRDQLAIQKAGPELQAAHDKIDDNKAAGKPLQEIAQLVGIPFQEIATDRSGKSPDGKVVLGGPDAQPILEAAFESQVGSDNEIIELSDGGYGWIDVLAITEPKQKSFEEVAEDVKALWRTQQTRLQLSELAAKLAERASAGEGMEKLAGEVGGKVETAKSFKRTGGAPGLPDTAVALAFSLVKGAATSAETRDRQSRVVFKLTDITPAPALTAADRDRLSAEVRRQMQGDVVSEYVVALQDRLGVSINESAFRRATGAERQ